MLRSLRTKRRRLDSCGIIYLGRKALGGFSRHLGFGAQHNRVWTAEPDGQLTISKGLITVLMNVLQNSRFE